MTWEGEEVQSKLRMKKGIYSFLLAFLKIGFAVGIFIYLLSSGKVDFQKIRSALSEAPWIFLSLLAMGVSIVVTSYRWRLLLVSQGISVSFKKILKLVFVGHFFNIVIPGAVSGDIVKAYYISKEEKNKFITTLSVLMDRCVGLGSLLVIVFFAILFNYSFIQSVPPLKFLGQIVMICFGLFLGALLFFLLKKDFSLSPKWPLFLRHLFEAFWSYRKCLRVVGQAGFLTLLNFLANVIVYYGAVRALGESSLPISYFFFLLPLGMFVMVLPIAPAGLGIGQGVFLKLFEWSYGKPVTVGADMVTIVQMMTVCWALVGLGVYIFGIEKVPQDLAYEQS